MDWLKMGWMKNEIGIWLKKKVDFEPADHDHLETEECNLQKWTKLMNHKTYLANCNLHPRLVDPLRRPLPAGFRPEQIKISQFRKKFLF